MSHYSPCIPPDGYGIVREKVVELWSDPEVALTVTILVLGPPPDDPEPPLLPPQLLTPEHIDNSNKQSSNHL